MDREGFRNRLKQYKLAREENPGLKYWEWKNIPKYDEGGEVKNPNLLRYKLNLPSVSTEDLPIVYDEKLDLENKIKLHETVVNQFLLKKSDIVLKFNKTADLYDVPKIKDKEITLSNAGSMTGAVLSTNLLDSIYKYANITGLPLIEAVGLPAQETAFGKWRNVGGHAYYNTPNDRDTRPDIITSDWLYTKPGVLHYVDMARLNAGYNASEKESIELLWDDAKDYDKRQLLHLRDKEANLKGQADYLKSKQKDIDKIFENFKIIPPLQHAYEYYKTGNYNKGDSSHKQDVIRKGREVMNSPEFKKWAKENNIKYAEGGEVDNPYSAGNLVNTLYAGMVKDEFKGTPWHKYDFAISNEEADKLGYFPDERGHRDDRVKKKAHPSHPSRGNWKSFYQYDLTDFGMNNSNHTLFGLVDGGLDPQAVLTYKGGIVLPELTVTPKKKYVHNTYDNIHLIY